MGTKRKQLPGDERKTQLLDAGAKLAVKLGAANVTRRLVAKEVKVAEALVSHYLGGTADAQKAYARHARKLGLTLPSKAESDAIGAKMRKHKPGDKRDTRKRSIREVRHIGNMKVTTTRRVPMPKERKPAAPSERKPIAPPVRPTPGPTERKTAARAPKAAPPGLQ